MALGTIDENFEKDPKMVAKYLAIFTDYRNNYIDDLPPAKLQPGDPNYYLYKCRGNCFVGVRGYISEAVKKGAITGPVAIAKGREFSEYVSRMNFKKFTTPVDIAKLNETLDAMIIELS